MNNKHFKVIKPINDTLEEVNRCLEEATKYIYGGQGVGIDLSGVSSGVEAIYQEYYTRRIRVKKEITNYEAFNRMHIADGTDTKCPRQL